MRPKEQILSELREGLRTGVIAETDIRELIGPVGPETVAVRPADTESRQEKLSAVDIMFYIAGIVLFSTIMSIIVQSWDDGNAFVHIVLSAVIGASLWAIAYYLIKSPFQSEIRKGLTNALLLTGSLLLIVGGYVITNELIGGFGEVNYIPGAFALAALGGLHIGYDRLAKRDLPLLMGLLLTVSAFPALLFGILQDADMPMDVWAVTLIITSGLLVYTTRVTARMYPDRTKIHNSFDSFAAFLALMCMYVASYGQYGIVWFMLLTASVFGIFYLSIILQNKHLLGNGSFFMVLTIITISFKYFSGFGITFSLIVATLGLLGSAAIAAGINKKYFKKPQ